MHLSTSASHIIISLLRSLPKVRIRVRNHVSSICATAILIEILQKEMIEYEVVVGDGDGFCVCVDVKAEVGIMIGVDGDSCDGESSEDNNLGEGNIIGDYNIIGDHNIIADHNFIGDHNIIGEDNNLYKTDVDVEESVNSNENLKLTKNNNDNNDVDNFNVIKYKDNNNDIKNDEFDFEKENKFNTENVSKFFNVENINVEENNLNNKINEENNLITKNNFKHKNISKKENDIRKNKNNKIYCNENVKKRKIFIVSRFKDENFQSTFSLYEMAKNLNYITNNILWPIKVLMSQENEEFSSESSEEENNECLKTEINIQVRKINKTKNEIIKENKFYRPFLCNSNLFSTLTKDLSLLKKYKKISHEKIRERLAKIGISLQEAMQPYNSVSCRTKMQIESSMEKRVFYIKKFGYENKIAAEEHFYLINYYLCTNKSLLGLLCLSKKKYVKNEYGKKFYDRIVFIINESFHKIKKIGKLNLFFVDKKYIKKIKAEVLLRCIYDKLNSITLNNCIVVCEVEEETFIVCEEFIDFGFEVLEKCFKIEKKMFKKCIDFLLRIK
ncbi:hypothetical protein COBT_001230 [Conglomerata obtusa]